MAATQPKALLKGKHPKVVTPKVTAVSAVERVQIRERRRLSRSGQEPGQRPLCQWARPQLACSLLGRPHSTVRPWSQDCVRSSKDACANGGGWHFAAAAAASL